MELLQAIFDRRSVRKFLQKPIEEEKLLKILDSGRWAPSAGNLQDWQFIIIREAGKRIQISEAAYGQYWISAAPVVIVLCSKTNRLSRIYGEIGDSFYSIIDTSMAAQNMLLTAHSLGLGSCIVPTFDRESARRILNIPDEIKVHSIIPIGYPAEKPNPPHRTSLENVVFFEEYGKTWAKDVAKGVRPVFIRRDEPFIDK